MPADTGVIIVLTNFPDRDSALAVARRLVEEKLAACVNVLEGCTSVYRWKGKLESEHEVTALIKTRTELIDAVESAIRSQHPYQLPEIVAVAVVAGFAPYLSWVRAETAG